MSLKLDLTTGNIFEKIMRLSMPIMGTSLILTAYNIVDMFWVGKVGSNAVAAVGTAGFYPWLALAFIMIARIGGEVRVAHAIGKRDMDEARSYVKSVLETNIVLAVLFTAFVLIFNKPLIHLFRIQNAEVNMMGRMYLVIVGAGMIFTFMNPVLTAIRNGEGDSSTPFKINTICLLINIVLDPVLIFGIGPFPYMGVKGAALATVLAQVVGTVLFLRLIFKDKSGLYDVKLFRNMDFSYHKDLFVLGFPMAIQSAMFTLINMALGVIVAGWGPVAIAAQKVGTQIESLCFMTADGMASGMSSFTGQNHGAKKYSRVKAGIKFSTACALAWGLLVALLMIFAGKDIFKLFINEPRAIEVGSAYLVIIGLSQPMNCVEIVATGVFKGLGRTVLPSVESVFFNALRIPAAIILSRPEYMGLDGVWATVAISTMFKGTVMLLATVLRYKTNTLYISKEDNVEAEGIRADKIFT